MSPVARPPNMLAEPAERSSLMRGPSGIIGLIVTLIVIFIFLRLLGVV